MPPQIIIDDTSSDLWIHWDDQWVKNNTIASAYKQTISTCDADKTLSSNLKPTVQIFFSGSSISLYGPQTADNIRVSYDIDRSLPRPAQLLKGSTPSQSGVKLWSLEDLEDTHHTITLYPENGTFSFDFITFKPSKQFSLVGQQLVLDDGDSQIQYSSGWAAPSDVIMDGISAQGIPFGGGVVGTNTVSANVNFTFIGSGVSVFGLLNQQAGRLSFSYSIDNSDPETVTPFSGTQAATNSWRLNQEFFHKDLSPGRHSVSLQLLEVTDSQMLWLDYVVFEGSSATTLTPSSIVSGTGSPTVFPGTTIRSTSSPTAQVAPLDLVNNPQLSPGAVGGVVVAALIVVGVGLFGLYCCVHPVSKANDADIVPSSLPRRITNNFYHNYNTLVHGLSATVVNTITGHTPPDHPTPSHVSSTNRANS